MRALADLICKNAFSELKSLRIFRDRSVTDAGVTVLVEALQKSKHTYLEELDLEGVGIGAIGMAALASLVDQGRLEQLKTLDISQNNALTQQGIITLARAIDERGLPMLQTFSMKRLREMTTIGISAIAHALI